MEWSPDLGSSHCGQLTNELPVAAVKRKKRAPAGTSTGKSIVVLKKSDVTTRNELVFMPNTIEMAQLKKPEKGQFKTNVQISSKMTQMDIKRILVENFPFLEHQRFWCASAVDDRTRLDFHGERRIWDGHYLKQTIKGNSALYIVADEQIVEEQDPKVSEQSSLKRSHDRIASVKNDQFDQAPKHTRHTANPGSEKIDTAMVPGGIFVPHPGLAQQIIPTTSDEQRNPVFDISRGHAMASQTLFSLEMHAAVPHVMVFSTLAPPISIQNNSNAASLQLQQHDDVEKCTGKRDQSAPILVENRDLSQHVSPVTMSAESNRSFADELYKNSAVGQPYDAFRSLDQSKQTTNVNTQVRASNRHHEHVGMPVFDHEVNTQVRASNRHHEDVGMSAFDHEVSGQLSSSSDFQTTSGISDDNDLYSSEQDLPRNLPDLQHELEVTAVPSRVPLQGGDLCRFDFKPGLPLWCSSGSATFGDLGTVNLWIHNNSMFGNKIPSKLKPGWVTVTLNSETGIYLGETKILYYSEGEKCVETVLLNPELLKDLLSKLAINIGGKTQTAGSETQNSANLGSTQPVQQLQLLVYSAAKSGDQQFIEMIFNSLAGRVIFDSYMNTSPLPEDIARNHGHEKTACYLEDITTRFSREMTICLEGAQAISWSEFGAAAEASKKQEELTSGVASEEENRWLENDENSDTDYFADVELSSCDSSELSTSDFHDDSLETFGKGSVKEDEVQLEENAPEKNKDENTVQASFEPQVSEKEMKVTNNCLNEGLTTPKESAPKKQTLQLRPVTALSGHLMSFVNEGVFPRKQVDIKVKYQANKCRVDENYAFHIAFCDRKMTLKTVGHLDISFFPSMTTESIPRHLSTMCERWGIQLQSLTILLPLSLINVVVRASDLESSCDDDFPSPNDEDSSVTWEAFDYPTEHCHSTASDIWVLTSIYRPTRKSLFVYVADSKDVLFPECFEDEDCELFMQCWKWQWCRKRFSKRLKDMQEQSGVSGCKDVLIGNHDVFHANRVPDLQSPMSPIALASGHCHPFTVSFNEGNEAMTGHQGFNNSMSASPTVGAAVTVVRGMATPRAQVKDGKTALMRATDHGHFDTSKLLLEAGAKIDLQDNEHFQFVKMAATEYDAEIKELNFIFKSLGKRGQKAETWKEHIEESVDITLQILDVLGENRFTAQIYGSTAEDLKCYDDGEFGDFDIMAFPTSNNLIIRDELIDYLPENPLHVRIKGVDHPVLQSCLVEDTEFVATSALKNFHPAIYGSSGYWLSGILQLASRTEDMSSFLYTIHPKNKESSPTLIIDFLSNSFGCISKQMKRLKISQILDTDERDTNSSQGERTKEICREKAAPEIDDKTAKSKESLSLMNYPTASTEGPHIKLRTGTDDQESAATVCQPITKESLAISHQVPEKKMKGENLDNNKDQNTIGDPIENQTEPKTEQGFIAQQDNLTCKDQSRNVDEKGALQQLTGGIDFVPALRCHGWPKVAREWITRKRKWPSPDIVNRIIQEGFHLVVKPAKNSGNPDCDFRLSFSHAEYLLSQEMNDIQRECYRCLKKIHRAYLSTTSHGLVTYHMKNLFLQTIEETGAEMWTNSNRVNCMMTLLGNLSEALKRKDLPHYFVRSYNLFCSDHIEDSEILESMAGTVEKIMENPIKLSKDMLQNQHPEDPWPWQVKTEEIDRAECMMKLHKNLLEALRKKDLLHFFVRSYNLFCTHNIEEPEILESLAGKVEQIICN